MRQRNKTAREMDMLLTDQTVSTCADRMLRSVSSLLLTGPVTFMIFACGPGAMSHLLCPWLAGEVDIFFTVMLFIVIGADSRRRMNTSTHTLRRSLSRPNATGPHVGQPAGP